MAFEFRRALDEVMRSCEPSWLGVSLPLGTSGSLMNEPSKGSVKGKVLKEIWGDCR